MRRRAVQDFNARCGGGIEPPRLRGHVLHSEPSLNIGRRLCPRLAGFPRHANAHVRVQAPR
jgi:hypothetical protein